MKRSLTAVGIFIALGVSLLSSGLGLYLLIRSIVAFAVAVLSIAALAIWLCKPMSSLWDSD